MMKNFCSIAAFGRFFFLEWRIEVIKFRGVDEICLHSAYMKHKPQK